MNHLQNILFRLFDNIAIKDLQERYRLQYLSEDELYGYRQKKFQKLVNYIEKNNEYYRKIGIDKIKQIADLENFPFLTKETIRNNFDILITKNLPKDRYIKNSTSGSTGDTLKFFSDNEYPDSYMVRGDSWTGWTLGEPKVVLWGADRDAKMTLKRRIKHSRFFYNTTILSSYEMRDEDIEEYIVKINKIKPSLIIGYPSSLFAFSEYVFNNNKKIWCPKGIITGGETLYEFQREILEKTFQCKVLNRYGSREVHHIANECKYQNGLHITADHIILEIVNENGEKCKPGELGEIVVTDLDNYVFPFIRYKTGDLGILADPNKKCQCGCNFPLLEKVEGRTFDLIIGDNGNRIPGNFFTLLRKKYTGFNKIQIVQKQIGEILINLETNVNFDEEQKNMMIQEILNKTGGNTNVIINPVKEILPTKSGKHRWIISEVSPFVNWN